MFRNMKLATKMGMGFGILILMSGVMGYVGFNALNQVVGTAEVAEQGSACMDDLNRCGAARRDFAVHGFEDYKDNGTSAADEWLGACESLQANLKTLSTSEALDAAGRSVVADVVTAAEKYREVFENKISAARKTKDAAWTQWGKVGWSVTEAIGKARTDTIAPALVKAQETKDAAEISKWAAIDERLQSGFIAPFLLLRVNAVYFAKTEKDAQYENYHKQLSTVLKGVEEWGVLVAGNSALETVATQLKGYVEQYKDAGADFYGGVLQDRSATAEMGRIVSDIVRQTEGVKTRLNSQMAGISAASNLIMIVMVIGGIVIGTVLGLVITRSIVKPINRVIAGLTDGGQQVSAASGQVSSSSQQLAEGASEQASSLEETSSSLEEMASMTKQNAANTKQANALATEALAASQKGDEAVGRLGGAIDKIKQSSDETARIIKVIDEIAFQTNLLALNAAVEAARAGEAGKGFAVVAEEVRNLAQRSAEAAKNTAELIEGAQENAENGVRVTGEVADSLTEIGSGVRKVTDLMGEVAAASDEQSRGVEQINIAVTQIDQVTQQIAGNAEESAAASEELSSQAMQLNQMVEDLASIVGGSGSREALTANRPAPTAAPTPTRPQTPQRKQPAWVPAGGTLSSTSRPNPEAVIPLTSTQEENMVLDQF